MTMAGEQKKGGGIRRRAKDAILKLFIDELVPITPGKGKFPESFVMGTEKAAMTTNGLHTKSPSNIPSPSRNTK